MSVHLFWSRGFSWGHAVVQLLVNPGLAGVSLTVNQPTAVSCDPATPGVTQETLSLSLTPELSRCVMLLWLLTQLLMMSLYST